ncbi:MAG: hypothetical protein AAGG51_28520 [Cyanobacteria bacterium P01_G01_bin.54]
MTDSAASDPDLTTQIQRILQNPRLSRQVHFQLVSRCLNGLNTTPEERQLINTVLDKVQMGKIKVYTVEEIN